MKRAAVLGSPIVHSLSPALHRAAYAKLGLDWTYDALECDERQLPEVVDALDETWAGLSLTMPLKRTVLPLLDDVSELVSTVGAANTVVVDGAHRRGENTDVGGMTDALQANAVAGVRTAAVLGAGATACSTLAALDELDVRQVDVFVRDPARTSDVMDVAERLGVSVRVRPLAELPAGLSVDLLVSALPSGAADGIADVIVRAGECPAVLDVCYDPWPTRLAAAAADAGCAVVGGFDLLLHQAIRQVALMTGRNDVPLEAMRAAGMQALTVRAALRP